MHGEHGKRGRDVQPRSDTCRIGPPDAAHAHVHAARGQARQRGATRSCTAPYLFQCPQITCVGHAHDTRRTPSCSPRSQQRQLRVTLLCVALQTVPLTSDTSYGHKTTQATGLLVELRVAEMPKTTWAAQKVTSRATLARGPCEKIAREEMVQAGQRAHRAARPRSAWDNLPSLQNIGGGGRLGCLHGRAHEDAAFTGG